MTTTMSDLPSSRAVQTDPSLTDNVLSRQVAAGLECYDTGAYEKAAGIFKSALRQAPDDCTVLRLTGLALTRAGKAEDGLPLLARAREIAPDQPLTHLHYGIGLQAIGRFAEAADIFESCLALLPDNPAPALNLAAACLDLGRVEAAHSAATGAIARAPHSAEAHYLLGLSELAAHRFAAARDDFSEATRLNPRFSKAWLNLGVVKYRLSDIQGAIDALNECLRVEPHNSMAEVNLAVLGAMRGQQEEAINRLRGVLARDPDCIAARVNLGSQLVIDREPVEALKVLTGSPPKGSLGVQWRAQRVSALLHLNRRPEARAELDAVEGPLGDAEILIAWRQLLFAVSARDHHQVERLAQRIAELADDEAGPLLEHRIIAHFDLARFRNSRRERKRAFDHWIKGHALIARSQPFSRSQYEDFFSATKGSYDSKRFAQGARANNRDITPLFIVGLPRSGTTLMEQVLSAHSAIHGAGERPDLHNCLSWHIGPPHQAGNIRKAANLTAATLSAAGRQYLVNLHGLAPGARYVTDKMPGNALHLGFIATLLPRSRIILCERDPRDVALSIFQLRFFGYHPYAHDLSDLGWYIGEHQKLMDHWHDVLPLPILKVRLEDWVNDFKGTLHRVLDFLDLPYEEACERFYATPRKVRTASVDQVRKPVNARGVGRWRTHAAELEPMLNALDHAGAIKDSIEDAQLRAAVLSNAHRPAAALGVLQKALTYTPNSPALLSEMAMCRLRTGEHDAARALAELTVAAAPDDWRSHVALCQVLAYSSDVSGAELATAMQRFGALLPRSETSPTFAPSRRRLRLGLLGLFHRSPVTALTLRAFEAMDIEHFEIVGFSVGRSSDSVTNRYRELGAYHEVGHLDDEQLAERIRNEGVDILIELTGLLRHGRLPTLARRMAPIQIKWAGAQYHTTGIAEVDYFITDRHETPPELTHQYSEKLLIMPDSYACWDPPADAPEIGPSPAAKNGFVTFGSFNSLMKLTASTLATWATILKRLPDSRLLLAAPALSEIETVERLRGVFRSHRVAENRVELRGWMPHQDLLAAYNEIDIALSPFPYNAGVTLLEGLWMGVPTVALSGESFASRHAASHLANAGLPDWVVDTVEAYVAKSVTTASDLSGLIDLRKHLRNSVTRAARPFADALGRALQALV